MEREEEQRQARVISALAALELSPLLPCSTMDHVVGCAGDHWAWRRQVQRLWTMLAWHLIDFLLINGSRNHPRRFLLPPAYAKRRMLTPVAKPVWRSWAAVLRKQTQRFGGFYLIFFYFFWLFQSQSHLMNASFARSSFKGRPLAREGERNWLK